LSSFGVGLHQINCQDFIGHEPGNFLYFIEETAEILEKYGLVKFNPFIYSNKECYQEDIFLEKYHDLIIDNKIKEAKELAIACGVEVLNKILDREISINNFNTLGVIRNKLLQNHHIGYDLVEMIMFELYITQDLIDYVNNDVKPYLVEEEEKKESIGGPLGFNPEDSYVRVDYKKCQIRKLSKQYHFLRVVFSDVKKDWQFSEISEELDHAQDYNWKRLHSVALALNTKIELDTRKKNFFLTTTQSVRINQLYINNHNNPSNIEDF
jgi:hypothetical protein